MNIKWQTGDTCCSCGYDGMSFIYEKVEPSEFGGALFFGTLICDNPDCNVAEDVIIQDDQVPDDKADEIIEYENQV